MDAPLRPVHELMDRIIPKYARFSERQFLNSNLTGPQMRVLVLLEELGPLSISEIARQLNTPDSNISNICSRLEKSGFITRKRQQADQRVVEIELTPLAKPQLKIIKEMFRGFHKRGSGFISREDIKDIVVGLSKLEALLDKISQAQK